MLRGWFRRRGQLFVLVIGLFGRGELDQLDLLELMLADDAADVFAVEPASLRKHGV